MTLSGKQSVPVLERALPVVLAGMAFFTPLAISPAEACAYLAVVAWAVIAGVRRDGTWLRGPLTFSLLLFVLLAVISVLWSIRPAVTLERVHRLLMLGTVFAFASAFSGEGGAPRIPLRAVAGAFVAGTTLRSIYDMIRVPLEISRGVTWFDVGNMRDPQMYLVALCFLSAWLLCSRPSLRARIGLGLATAANAAGLLLHFKRGAWIAAILTLTLLALAAGRRRFVIGMAVCVAALLLVPQVRERLGHTRDESEELQGGRYALWTQVAPRLLLETPQGLGYGAVRNEDFRLMYGGYIQPHLNHLHDNLLQVAAELGWVGLAVWLFWMGRVIVLLMRQSRSPVRPGESPGLALGALAAFVGLLFNGVVEYNFGDSEILLVFCLLMGLAAVPRPLDIQAGGATLSPCTPLPPES